MSDYVEHRKVKLVQLGRAQALRLPKAFEFADVDEVYISREPVSGNLVISRESPWTLLFRAIDSLDDRDQLSLTAVRHA